LGRRLPPLCARRGALSFYPPVWITRKFVVPADLAVKGGSSLFFDCILSLQGRHACAYVDMWIGGCLTSRSTSTVTTNPRVPETRPSLPPGRVRSPRRRPRAPSRRRSTSPPPLFLTRHVPACAAIVGGGRTFAPGSVWCLWARNIMYNV